MSLKDTFGRFFGDPELENIESFVNDVLTSRVDIPTATSDEFSSDFVSDIFEKEKPDELIGLLNKFDVSPDRIVRYNAYDELYRSVPLIKRIVKIYKPYIIQKNQVTGSWYVLRNVDKPISDTSEYEKNMKDVKKFIGDASISFDILQKLKNQIVHQMLIYGDSYVEVVDLKKAKEEIDLTKPIILNEQASINKLLNEVEQISRNNYSATHIDMLIESVAEKLIKVDNEIDQNEISKQEYNYNFPNTLIRVHKPHKIVVLETEYGSKLGFLEIRKSQSTSEHHNIAQSLSLITNKIANITSNAQSNYNEARKDIINRLTMYILRKVTENKDKNIKFAPEVIDNIKRFFVEQNIQDKMQMKKIDVRFIPVSKMVCFNLNSTDNAPYGESIVDPLILPGKLFILSQLANIVMKLSRSTQMRRWIIDSGSTQMPNQVIQKLKRELASQRVSVADINSYKNTVKILSDFKDLFVIQRDGRRALDMEPISLGDPNIKTQDLEDSRRELLAIAGIPPQYAGYPENIELREQLVQTNVHFAIEISDIQDTVNTALQHLIDTIADVEGKSFTPSEYSKITLIPPTSLMLQLIEATLGSVGSMFGVLQSSNVAFDPYFFLEQYIPFVDWNDFKKKSEDYQLKLSTKAKIEQVEGGGVEDQMGGGVGGGFR